MEKECKYCGKSFVITHGLQKYCDKDCKSKGWVSNNKERWGIYRKEYKFKNKERIAKKAKEWKFKNRDKIRKRQENYKLRRNSNMKLKRKSDEKYRITGNLRGSLNILIRQFSKNQYDGKYLIYKYLQCDSKTLMNHFESKFKEGMNWKNYGKWHIDHIIPCCKFDLTIEEEKYKCFHYLNIQPLWAMENLEKGTKIIS